MREPAHTTVGSLVSLRLRTAACALMMQHTELVCLRPYTRELVTKYHDWMADEWLQGEASSACAAAMATTSIGLLSSFERHLADDSLKHVCYPAVSLQK